MVGDDIESDVLGAQALGVTSAALFHRAGTRERLVISAMTLTDPREFKLLALLRRGPASGTPVRTQLIEVLLSLNAHLAKITPCLLFMHAAGVKTGRRRELPDKTRRFLASWLRQARRLEGIEFRNASTVAQVLVGTLEARQLWRCVHRTGGSIAIDRAFVRSLVSELFP